MGKLVLYGLEPSPPVRACKMTLNALDLKYEYKLINLRDSEHKTKEFVAKNPQHTVPLLEDDGKCIWDSHAICAYLVRKYGKNDALYPKDYYRRAIVDQRLHFEGSVIFQGCLRNIAVPIFYHNKTEVPREKIVAIYEAYDFLEAFIGKNPYVAGPTMTIADFSCVSSVSSFHGLAPVEPARYPNIHAWLERMAETVPDYQTVNGNGAQMLIDMFTSTITKIV